MTNKTKLKQGKLEVIMDEYPYKYVVAEIDCKDQKDFYLAASEKSTHIQVAGDLKNKLCERKELDKTKLYKFYRDGIIGGGKININREKKSITTWDYSRSYGAVDTILVKKILDKNFPDYEITVKDPYENESY